MDFGPDHIADTGADHIADTGADHVAGDITAELARAAAHVDRREARLLLAQVLARPVEWLLAHNDEPIDTAAAMRFRQLVLRRARGEPIAYLLGRREFYGRAFNVGPAVLIPRPETEGLVDLVLRHLPVDTPAIVLDLGTGSGAIAVTLAAERPHARLHAVDASARALRTAAANARAHHVEERITFMHGDWTVPDFVAEFGELRFDAIVSNPPYIADGDPHLEQGDLRFEPPMALGAGPRGDEALQCIAAVAPLLLAPGGLVALEHGFDQGGRCRDALERNGLSPAMTETDLNGLDRITWSRPTSGRNGPSDA